MKQINVFKHEMFGEVRTMTDEKGETFFVGKDVAMALGYSDTKKAIRAHVDNEDKGGAILSTPGGIQKAVVINESGLYALILSSKLDQAKAFKRWVTSEVLPAIRKTGRYELGPKELQVLGEKADYCDEVLDSVSCYTTTQVAKEMGMTVFDLTTLLLVSKVMYRQSDRYLLYADYARKGYAKSRTHGHYDREGRLHTFSYLVWTEAGRKFIHRFCNNTNFVN